MKKSIIFLMMLAVVCIACEPVENRESNGSAITADQLNISATTEVVNGINSNKIILENNSPVNSLWDYGVGTSIKAYDEVLVGSTGNVNIIFTGLNPDGTTITKTLSVQVDEIIYDTPFRDNSEQMNMLTGGNQKVWVWDPTTDGVFGNGEWIGNSAPAWWVLDTDAIDEQAPGEGANAYMIFSLEDNSLTKVYNTGVEEKGSFSISVDTDKYIYDGDGNLWSLGKLYTENVTVLAGISINEDKANVYEYSILKLTDEELILAYDRYDAEDDWTEGWFWVFRAK